MAFKVVSVLLTVGLFIALTNGAHNSALPMSQGMLSIKVSGRNFQDLDSGWGTSDPYYEVFVSTDGGKTKTKLITSDHLTDKENPDWSNVISLDFDRSLNQLLYFHVYDDDTLSEDETIGRAWVNVNDYVDKGQLIVARLDKERGYLILQSTTKLQHPSNGAPLGQLGSLPTSFFQSQSDPYVIIYSTEGLSDKDKQIGKSGVISNTNNPAWGDIFTFDFDRSKDQWLHFVIYDEDTLRKDDKLGTAWLQVTDYVAKGQSMTIPLPKSGTLIITKA